MELSGLGLFLARLDTSDYYKREMDNGPNESVEATQENIPYACHRPCREETTKRNAVY